MDKEKIITAENVIKKGIARLFVDNKIELETYNQITSVVDEGFNYLISTLEKEKFIEDMKEIKSNSYRNRSKRTGVVVPVGDDRKKYTFSPDTVIKKHVKLDESSIVNMLEDMVINNVNIGDAAKKWNVSWVTAYRRVSEFENKKGMGWDAYKKLNKKFKLNWC